jgi:hypothetical protein
MGALLEDAALIVAHLEGANLRKAHLEGAALMEAHLEGADLMEAHLEGANLRKAHLEGAALIEAHLEGAALIEAHLEGAALLIAHLEGVNALGSIVDGKTLIASCYVDGKTNFAMVGLDSARIDPSLLARLKTNIRRFAWKDYYETISTSWRGRLKANFCRFFWYLSDYGSNTSRILLMFFIFTIIFTGIYLFIANNAPGVLTYQVLNSDTAASIPWWLDLVRNFCFAVATMVTLGFGGINVAIVSNYFGWSAFAFVVVTFNLFIGYFLLAVLVTRIGILFQSLGPEAKVEKKKR